MIKKLLFFTVVGIGLILIFKKPKSTKDIESESEDDFAKRLTEET